MAKKQLAAVSVVAVLILAGCASSGVERHAGDVSIHQSSDSITLDEGESDTIQVSVVEWNESSRVNLSAASVPDGIDVSLERTALREGGPESANITFTSHENVELMPISYMCGEVMCTMWVPHYDGHEIVVLAESDTGTAEISVNVDA